ncbi:hypothetical protein O0L34_g7160 [Tuta absoluta]|nr:hypothetical protein O0L34_g7160 [Tuta absoluta]
MSKCNKCSKTVNKRAPGLQCNKCSKWFHSACLSLPNELLLAISTNDAVDWKCRSCINGGQTKKRASVILPEVEEEEDETEIKDNTPKIKIDLGKATPNQVLEDMNKKLEKLELLQEMKKKLDDVSASVDYLSKQYDKLIENQVKLEKKIMTVENKNVYLEKCNKALEERVSALEAKSKDKNIEVSGLLYKEGEDIISVVKEMSVKLELNPDSICEAVRVVSGNADKKQRPPPVIVQLASQTDKNKWLAKKKGRLTNGQVFNVQDDTPIYINEDLPRSTRQLLWNAKQVLKDECRFKFVWVQGGRILARQDESEEHKKIYTIRTDGDLEYLKKTFLKCNK